MIDEILSLVKEHEEWRGKCLNLIPSENVTSHAVRKLLSSDLGHRYTARDKFYMGTKFIDEIESYGEKIAREIFKAEVADLRPLSGHIANLIFLASFTENGDTIMCTSPENGGYPGIWKNGLAGLLGLKVAAFPFSKRDMNIKVEEAKQLIEHVKPKALIFGASLITFPHPVKELAEVAKENNAIIGFDGSHVLGLIAGGEFQDPLREGATVLFGSTHKTFFGPQGGIFLADKEHGELMKNRVYPAYVDNAHWNRIAALTLALAEMKNFGEAYAKQVVKNARTLAEALHDYGFPVVSPHLGFTKSHQIILDYGNSEQNYKVAEKLQKANIIVDRAIRIGTSEVTRRGMKENEMLKIAELIKRTVIDGEQFEKIRREVAKLNSEFQKIEYCFY
ncbi:aminotransferase class I/II-fold pyridoxal phosphate-dependent enzyme [Candidatus Bathyarchaeota archaeon]|nr:aminotransferase class I/II-fold pyridoxal phosphate-dependent enzyme [Candidatus Bathyarchaeota archaeon]